MSRPVLILTALSLLAHGACSQSRSDSKGKQGTKAKPANTQTAPVPPKQTTAIVSDADGGRVATLVQTPAEDKCTFVTNEVTNEVADKPLRVQRAKDGALQLVDDSGNTAGSISGAKRVMLQDATGKQIGRVVQPPQLQAVSLIDAQGVAMFRIRIDKQGRAIVRDKASMPVLVVHNRGGRFVAETKSGAVRAYVTGEEDPMVAALLTTEFVELRLRGLLACDWALGRTKKYVP